MKQLALGYARVSVGEADSLSIASQEQRLREHFKASGWHCVGVVADPGVSAGVPLEKRPGGKALCRQLAHPDAEGLVVAAVRLDRLFRSAFDATRALDRWTRAGVRPVLLDIGLDFGTPTGKFVFATLAACAELERDLIRLRTKDAMREARRRGTSQEWDREHGIGYSRSGEVIRSEFAALGRALELTDPALGPLAIPLTSTVLPRRLADEGHKPRRSAWARTTLRRAIHRTRRDPAQLRLAVECLAEWRASRPSPPPP